MGYDISDYMDIDGRYGSLIDVDELIAQLKKRDMKLMMDLVVNHTSDQRGWYFWKKGKIDTDGKRLPPNNWCRILDTTKSAWQWDEETQEYYLSLFSPEQPDLNWDNPNVRAAVHDILRFWLNRGVCGFRMDVIDHISKVQSFPDADRTIPGQYCQPGNAYYANGPRLHEFLHEMKAVLDEYDTITVGEMPFVNDEDEIIRTVGMQGSLNMIFLFKILNMDNEPGQSKWSYHEWDATDMKRIHDQTQRLMIERGGWNAIFTENHDGPRSISRFADDSDQWRDFAAKMLCTKSITLGGTEYIYQGQELGMRNIPSDWSIDEYKDVESQSYWRATPMQWSAAPNAGFSKSHVKPWMRVNDDYPNVNVVRQLADPDSVLSYWKRCLKFRREHKEVFIYGGFEILDPEDKDVVAFRRFSEHESFVTVTNFTGKHLKWSGLGEIKIKEWVIGNYELESHNESPGKIVKLRPWEGIIGRS
ncbi:unnamed protein product [Aureobasidium uvarum]|uniref:Glycosyl hydrolase family 13 catalytic domain-containing protein n=1 Tax=Aureobasidium uvarum TaxID=2773716 RepID=A0A9N8PUS1_9PEZI|nr:unnamed protein product [Aureobasidium uvarum]